MKKLLLSMVALLCVIVGKANIVEDFTVSGWMDPVESANDPAEYTSPETGITYTVLHCKKGAYQNASYLQISGKSYQNNAYLAFPLPEGTSAITVKTGSNASTNVTVTVTVGETTIATDLKLGERNADFTFDVPEALQNSKAQTKILVTNKYNAQFQSLTFVTEGGGETPVDPDPVTPDPEPEPDPEPAEEADATFNFTEPGTLGDNIPADYDANGLTVEGSNKSLSVAGVKFTKGNVTLSATDGGTPTKIYYQGGNNLGKIQLRVYNGGTLTFVTDEPTIHLSKIVFTFNSTSNIDKMTVGEGEGIWTAADHTWTGDLRKLTFSFGGTVQINTIEVYTAVGDPIELPEPEPEPETPEATKVDSIKALLDANTAVESGKFSEGEFTLDFPVTVIYSEGQNNYVTDGTTNLLIYGNLGKTGLENGKVLPAGITGKYKNQGGLPELTSVTTSTVGDPTDGTPVEPVATTVEDANAEGLSAYIVIEGVTISGVNGKNFTITEGEATIAGYNSLGISVAEGENLTITGFVSIYGTTFQIAPVTITAAGGKEVVAAPTFDPKAGEVAAGTKVTIATTTEGASIYYTIDGTAPTTASTLYSEPVEIAEALTIKAFAVKEGCDDSEVAEAAYTVKAPADATFNFSKPASLTPGYPADKEGEGLEADGNNKQAVVTGVKFTNGNVSVVSTKGTTTDAKIYYQAAGAIQLRVYNGGSTTFTTDEPTIHLAKIVFHYNNGATSYNNVTAPAEGSWDKETGTWTATEGTRQVTFAYTGTQQINSIEVYTSVGDPIELPEPEPEPEATKVTSIKALIDANTEVESGKTSEGEFTLDFPVTVIYSEGQNNYVTDGTTNLLIYGNLGKTGLENGKVLPAGLTGKYKNQNGLPELVSVTADTVGEPTDGTPVEPVATTVEDANAEGLSAYVVIEGVTISGVNGKNFTITDTADNTIAGYNSLGISVAEGENLIVTGFVSIYNTTWQIAPVSITNAQGKETVAAPTFNPEGGEVLAGTRVNIYTTTEGASIYYTLDGTEPTAASTLYETAIEITADVTIKAIAVKEGCEDSEVAEAVFTLKAPADATFNFASPASLTPGYPADKEGEGLEADGTSGFYANVTDVKFTNNDIEVVSTKGASTDARLYYQTSGKVQLRVYNGGSTTISSASDKLVITKIVITYNNGNTSYNKVVAPAEGTWDKETGTWTTAEGTTGVASVKFEYTGTVQINAIEVFTAEASGIDAIAADEAADAEYFNLQGVRVDNPAPGLYIRRQGTEVTKVIIR